MDVIGHVGELLGTSAVRMRRIGHSHAWTLNQAQLADGREVFVKVLDEPPSERSQRTQATASEERIGVFEVEAAGLRWLAEADPGDLVPPVLAADDRMLILPWLPPASASSAAAERFGHDLATLHAATPDSYGASWPGRIATLPLDNSPTAGEWGSWYAERRLAPYLPAAAPILGRDGIQLVETVIDRIDELAGPPEPPSRIHGDLWSGNVHWTDGRAVLIDPAAHGGHRETDLAMLDLFGAPHLGRVLAAYNEQSPLGEGWRQRIPLHQLHPLLVHVVLFGDSYRGRALAAASAALGESGLSGHKA